MEFKVLLLLLILVLLLVKFIADPLFRRPRLTFEALADSRLWVPLGILWLLHAGFGIIIADHLLVIILINAIIWSVFYIYLRGLGYQHLVWISFLFYWLYMFAIDVTFGKVSSNNFSFYTLFALGITAIFLLIYDTLAQRVRYLSSVVVWIVYTLLLIIPAAFIVYAMVFDSPVRHGQLYAIYQTDYPEALAFLKRYISPGWPLLLAGIAGTFGFFLIHLERSPRKPVNQRSFWLILASVSFLGTFDPEDTLKFPGFLKDSLQTYQEEVGLFKRLLERRKKGITAIQADKPAGKELYVVIIGESLNKHHTSLYGYARPTTPNLMALDESDKLIKFEEAFSCHVHTAVVLPRSLTAANLQNRQNYVSAPSILDIFEGADFDTYWLSNQVRFSSWDNPVSVLAERADHQFYLNDNIDTIVETVHHDEKLAEQFALILEGGIPKNTAVFIHLIGNHWEYAERYPPDFARFHGTPKPGILGRQREDVFHDLNAYDNSILYHDQVVARIVQMVEASPYISATLYFADHADDVLDRRGHNSGQFSFAMTQIPMFIWLSESYRQKYPHIREALVNNQRRFFSNDLVYDLLVGLSGISTDHYEAIRDISSREYQLDAKDCFTLNGKVSYTSRSNHYVVQRENLAAIDSAGQLQRIFPHRVNSLGKLNQIQYEGCRAFETDLVFREGSFFEVGHDEHNMSGITFESLLSHIDTGQASKIWLDIKNLSEENHLAVLDRLNTLDQQFGLKKLAIIESSITSKAFSIFSEAGYHTSYYLPTALKNITTQRLPRKAKVLREQIQQQAVKAISFDIALYPFVKDHLEPIIGEDIDYHTWDLSMHLKDEALLEKLSNTRYYRDSRIQSILINYQSEFGL